MSEDQQNEAPSVPPMRPVEGYRSMTNKQFEELRTSTPFEFNVSAEGALAVSMFRAHEDIRYYLHGVAVLPHPSGGVILVATDGHRMGLYYDQHGQATREGIMRWHPDMARYIRQRGPLQKRLVTIKGRPTVAYAEPDSLVIDDSPTLIELFCLPREGTNGYEIQGRFPDISRICSKLGEAFAGQRGLCGHINSELLDFCVPVYRILTQSMRTHAVWRFHQSDPDSTIFGFTDSEKFAAVIMPMRSTHTPSAPPVWLDVVSQK